MPFGKPILLLVGVTLGFSSPSARASVALDEQLPQGSAEQAQRTQWEHLMSDGETARRNGDYPTARGSCEKAITIARNFPRTDTHLAQSQVQLGNIYLSERKVEEAEPYFREAVASCERAVGSQHPVMTMPLESLANCYFTQKRFDQVALIYERILKISEHGVVLQNLEVGRRARNLADVYFSANEYTKAEPLFLRAIQLAEPSGDITALIDFHMAAGRLYDAWKKSDNAADQYRTAADLAGGLENDFQTFQALQALTAALKAERRFDLAEGAAGKAVALREKRASSGSDGDAQLDLAVSLNNLAEVYIAWSKPERAEPLYHRALDIVEKVAPTGSNEPVTQRVALAGAQRLQGKFHDAEEQYKEALSQLDKSPARDVTQLAGVLTDYATLLNQMEKPDEAQKLLVRANTTRKETALR